MHEKDGVHKKKVFIINISDLELDKDRTIT